MGVPGLERWIKELCLNLTKKQRDELMSYLRSRNIKGTCRIENDFSNGSITCLQVGEAPPTETQNNLTVDNIYFDSNGIIHEAAQQIEGYGKCKRRGVHEFADMSPQARRLLIFERYFELLVQYTESVKPRKIIYISIDGAAPDAKQNQQRERRFKRGYEKIQYEEDGEIIVEMNIIPVEEGDFDESFDQASITPGTSFMHELDQFMNYAIRREIEQNDTWKRCEVVYSPHTVPGEGEHKILDYIRGMSDEQKENETHCIWGPDGDLFMLTLSSHIKEMYLFRNDQFNFGYFRVYDMRFIAKALQTALTRHHTSVIDDFVWIGFFVGNDFLPKLKMFYSLKDGLNKMVDVYKTMLKSSKKNILTKKGKLQFKGLKSFFASVAKFEKSFIVEQAEIVIEDEKYNDYTLLDHVSVTSNFERLQSSTEQILLEHSQSIESEELRDVIMNIFMTILENEEADKKWMKDQEEGESKKEWKMRNKDRKERYLSNVVNGFFGTDISMDEFDDFEWSTSTALLSMPYTVRNRIMKMQSNRDRNNINTILAWRIFLNGFGEEITGLEPRIFANRMLMAHKHFRDNRDVSSILSKLPKVKKEIDDLAWKIKKTRVYSLHDSYRDAYYDRVIESHSQSEIDSMCKEYVKTLIWTYMYYVDSLPSWEYYYPYHYTPLLSDVSLWFSKLTEKKFSKLLEFDYGTATEPFVQLLSIVSKSSQQLLPSPVRSLMFDEDMEVNYPETFIVDHQGVEKADDDYKAIIILPFAPRDLIQRKFNKMRRRYEKKNGDGSFAVRYKRNDVGDHEIIFSYNEDTIYKIKTKFGTLFNIHVDRVD